MNKFATEEYAELRERARRDGRGTSWEANGALLRVVEEKLQGFCKAASFGTSEDDSDGLAVLGLDNFEVTFRLCVEFKTEAGRAYKGLERLGVGGVHRFIITAEVAQGKLKSYWVTDLEDRRRRFFKQMPGWGRDEAGSFSSQQTQQQK